MDILSEKNALKCIHHPNELSTFIKINQINTSNKILYCEICIEEDNTFASKNFLNIKNIIQSFSFLQKWPPVDDNQVVEQIMQIQSNIENSKSFEQKIIKYFDELKNEIILKIGDCQKSMIRLSSEKTQENKNMVQKIKEISNIENMKNIVINSELNQKEKESELRQFIVKAHNQKEQNKQQIKNILNESNLYNQKISFEKSELKKIEILSLIDNQKFFGINHGNEEQGMNLIKGINQNNKIEDILAQLNILKAQIHKETNSQIEISQQTNNQIEINCKSGDGQRLYSNIILEENKKYIFKFKFHINSFQHQVLFIGLINDLQKDQQLQNYQYFYQSLNFEKSSLQMLVRKGDFGLNDEIVKDVREVEMRVHLQNQIVDIIFPNHSTLSLQPQFKQYLRNNNYRLYLFPQQQISVTITTALICDKFED